MFLNTRPPQLNQADERNIRLDPSVTPEKAGAYARLGLALVLGVGGLLLAAKTAHEIDEVPTAEAVMQSEDPTRENLEQLLIAGEVLGTALVIGTAAKIGIDAINDLDSSGQ